MDDINSTMRTASNQLTDKMRAVTAQVSVVSNLMLDAVEEISDPGSKTIYEDESEDLIASQSDGKIENSINRGSIDADMNVGGIAGTMGVENLLDPEEDNKDEVLRCCAPPIPSAPSSSATSTRAASPPRRTWSAASSVRGSWAL